VNHPVFYNTRKTHNIVCTVLVKYRNVIKIVNGKTLKHDTNNAYIYVQAQAKHHEKYAKLSFGYIMDIIFFTSQTRFLFDTGIYGII